MSAPLKLTFDERDPLQLMLQAVVGDDGAAGNRKETFAGKYQAGGHNHRREGHGTRAASKGGRFAHPARLLNPAAEEILNDYRRCGHDDRVDAQCGDPAELEEEAL